MRVSTEGQLSRGYGSHEDVPSMDLKGKGKKKKNAVSIEDEGTESSYMADHDNAAASSYQLGKDIPIYDDEEDSSVQKLCATMPTCFGGIATAMRNRMQNFRDRRARESHPE